MKTFTMPFQMGDVVKYVKHSPEDDDDDDGVWKIGEKHIIDTIQRVGSTWEYSTNKGAWIEHNSFELVRKADKTSLKQLLCDKCEE